MEEKNKFVCDRCGLCCTKFEEGDNGGINVFEFEREEFLKLAKELGVEKEIFIKKLPEEFVGGYEIRFLGKCPFLKDNKCSIHKNRPIHCRCFPIDNVLDNGEMLRIDFNYACKNMRDLTKGINGQIRRSDTFLKLYEYYGDVFLWALEKDFLIRMFVNLKNKTGFSGTKPFLKTLQKQGVLTNEEISKYLKEMYELKHAKEYLNEIFKKRGWDKKIT